MKAKVVVGLALSFPIAHECIESGAILNWTKGFDIEGSVGRDAAELLQNAFQKQARHLATHKPESIVLFILSEAPNSVDYFLIMLQSSIKILYREFNVKRPLARK